MVASVLILTLPQPSDLQCPLVLRSCSNGISETTLRRILIKSKNRRALEVPYFWDLDGYSVFHYGWQCHANNKNSTNDDKVKKVGLNDRMWKNGLATEKMFELIVICSTS